MSIKKNKNQLIISIIVGVAIAVISYQVIVKLKIENDNLKKMTQTSAMAPIKKIEYVVAKKDIKKGDKIDPQNLTTKQFPVEIEGAISDVSKITGLNTKKDIKADAPIVEDYFKVTDMDIAAGEPQSGYRAVGILIGTEQFPSFARDGAYVDIYFTKNIIQAQNIRILSVQDAPSGSAKSVMLEIKERDVAAFIAAANEDKPVLVQRNRHERSGYKFSGGSAINFSHLPQAPGPELVEISDVSYDEPPRTNIRSSSSNSNSSTFTKKVQSGAENNIPLVKSGLQAGEIEFISGDKKMIVGTPGQW